jgi:hypothetical protein
VTEILLALGALVSFVIGCICGGACVYHQITNGFRRMG